MTRVVVNEVQGGTPESGRNEATMQKGMLSSTWRSIAIGKGRARFQNTSTIWLVNYRVEGMRGLTGRTTGSKESRSERLQKKEPEERQDERAEERAVGRSLKSVKEFIRTASYTNQYVDRTTNQYVIALQTNVIALQPR